MVGDSKKPYTNPNHTNNSGQVVMIAETSKMLYIRIKSSIGPNYKKASRTTR